MSVSALLYMKNVSALPSQIPRAPSSRTLAALGWAAVALCALAILVRFARESPRKLLWYDELLTLYQVQGKSFSEFLQSLSTGVNLLPPLYFVVPWGLGHVTVLDATVLRITSVICLLGGLVAVYIVLRRLYSEFVAVVALVGVFMWSGVIVAQGYDARPYALCIFLVALFLEALSRAALEPGRQPWGRLVWLGLLSALMPATHYFLGVYSALGVLSVFVGDVRRRRARPAVYIAIFAGWTVFFLTCGAVLLGQAGNVVNGTQWIHIPNLREASGILKVVLAELVPGMLAFAVARWVLKYIELRQSALPTEEGRPVSGMGRVRGSALWVGPVFIFVAIVLGAAALGPAAYIEHYLAATIGVGLLITAFGLSRPAREVRRTAAFEINFLAATWCALPIVALVASFLWHKGYYLDRYYASSVVGWAVLMAWLGERFMGGTRGVTLAPRVMRVAIAAVGVFVVVSAARFVATYESGWVWGRHRIAPEIYTVDGMKVTSDIHAYMHAAHYAPHPNEWYLLVLDDAEQARLRKYSEAVQTISAAQLETIPRFIWVTTPDMRKDIDFSAAENGGYLETDVTLPEKDTPYQRFWRTYRIVSRTPVTKGVVGLRE